MLNVFRLTLALLFLYTFSPFLNAQDAGMKSSETDIPITTSSETAMQKYIEGRSLNEDFQFEKANELFKEALELDPDFALAYVGKAVTAGSYSKAVKNIDKAAALADKVSPGEKLYIHYQKAAFEGDQNKQEELLGKLMDMYPSDKRILMEAAQRKYGAGEYNKAVAYLEKAASIDPDFAPAHNMLGYSYAGIMNYSEAEKAFKTYISLKPDLPNAYDSYAECLLKEGKYDESITQYKTALEKDPQFYYSLQGLGDNYCFKKDYAKAREYYQKQHDQAATNNVKYAALYSMSVSYVKERKIQEALNVLDKRASIAEKNGDIPTVVSSLNSKGLILAESGDPDNAEASFQTALDKIKSSQLSDDVKKNMKTAPKLNLVYVKIMQNKLDDSKQKLDNMEETVMSSNDVDNTRMFNFLRGTLALKQDKPDEAIEYFSKAGNENPIVWRNMAAAYSKKGDTEKALECKNKIDGYQQNNLIGALSVYKFQEYAEIEPE